jgi:hypothetical protein
MIGGGPTCIQGDANFGLLGGELLKLPLDLGQPLFAVLGFAACLDQPALQAGAVGVEQLVLRLEVFLLLLDLFEIPLMLLEEPARLVDVDIVALFVCVVTLGSLIDTLGFAAAMAISLRGQDDFSILIGVGKRRREPAAQRCREGQSP